MVESIREQGDPKIEGNHLNENRNMNSKNHTVEERALMQRVWNDPSQVTQAKELCLKQQSYEGQ